MCRIERGQKFTLLSHGRLQYIVQLKAISKNQAEGEVLETVKHPQRSKPFIHLALSCPRFSVLESLLPKLVELNITGFHPFVSDLSFIRKPSSLGQKRKKRWNDIIHCAMAQSLNPQGMEFSSVVELSALLEVYKKRDAQALFFYEGKGGVPLQTILEEDFQALNEIWVFIGSEGGFSSKEADLFKAYRIAVVTLGSSILKVETACLTVLGILKYKLGQW